MASCAPPTVTAPSFTPSTVPRKMRPAAQHHLLQVHLTHHRRMPTGSERPTQLPSLRQSRTRLVGHAWRLPPVSYPACDLACFCRTEANSIVASGSGVHSFYTRAENFFCRVTPTPAGLRRLRPQGLRLNNSAWQHAWSSRRVCSQHPPGCRSRRRLSPTRRSPFDSASFRHFRYRASSQARTRRGGSTFR